MTHRVVALYHSPWPCAGLTRPASFQPIALYRYAIWYRANPRSADYMRALLQEHFPTAEWLNTSVDTDWIQRISRADTIILLYPDAIGLGFAGIERIIATQKSVWTNVHVLNGRRRCFHLNSATRRGLRLRRVLARTMFVEFLMLPIFVIATPVLWVIDAMRGRT